jgi:ribosomal protein S18 acetylase RimI-like enzyme
MPEITIHSVGSEDLESLQAFEHGYYSEYVWQMSMEVEDKSAEADFRCVRLPRRVFVPYPRKRDMIFSDWERATAFLVGELAGRAVGYLKVQAESESRVARITDLVVSSPMRRQGIASGLILAAMDLIAHRDFYLLIMEMQSKNYPAIQMMNKLGFSFCGFRDHYFPNQDLALFFSRFTH